MKLIELSNNQFSKVKEVSNIYHISESGLNDALYFRMVKRCSGVNQFITNFSEKLKDRKLNTESDSLLANLYLWEYDIVTVPEEYREYVKTIINNEKKLARK